MKRDLFREVGNIIEDYCHKEQIATAPFMRELADYLRERADDISLQTFRKQLSEMAERHGVEL